MKKKIKFTINGLVCHECIPITDLFYRYSIVYERDLYSNVCKICEDSFHNNTIYIVAVVNEEDIQAILRYYKRFGFNNKLVNTKEWKKGYGTKTNLVS